MGVGNISQSKGSSYLEMGGTKVICGVYGPKECAQGNTFRPIGKAGIASVFLLFLYILLYSILFYIILNHNQIFQKTKIILK